MSALTSRMTGGMSALTSRMMGVFTPARLSALMMYLASFLVALALATALVMLTGYSMTDTAVALYQGSLGDGRRSA